MDHFNSSTLDNEWEQFLMASKSQSNGSMSSGSSPAAWDQSNVLDQMWDVQGSSPAHRPGWENDTLGAPMGELPWEAPASQRAQSHPAPERMDSLSVASSSNDVYEKLHECSRRIEEQNRTIKQLVEQQMAMAKYHNELQEFLSLTGQTMKALTNYVNADWEAKTPLRATMPVNLEGGPRGAGVRRS